MGEVQHTGPGSTTGTQGLTFGRYRLVERIAAGGMGEVYVGLQTGIGRFSRPIAIKLLLPHLADDPASVSMFLTEARVGAQMTHANIAQVYDVGLEADRYYIAMELVRGVALQKLITGLKSAREQLPLELFAYVARSLCDGLHVAHEQVGADGQPLQLVHRDVTPHNVLVSVDGAVKLTDFGIARVADADRLSRPGVVLGKLGYLAPEQILGQPIDRRADLFSTGASLFHLAALEKPFDTVTGSTLDPRRTPAVPLATLRPDLPRQVTDAVERALAVDPAARFQTARELRNAFPVPGPDAGEALGALVRRVCAAALVELEQKTERATHVLQEATRPSAPRGATPPARALASAAPVEEPSLSKLPSFRSRTPAVVAAVLAVGLVGGAVALLQRDGARPAAAADPAGGARLESPPTPEGRAPTLGDPVGAPEPAAGDPAKSAAPPEPSPVLEASPPPNAGRPRPADPSSGRGPSARASPGSLTVEATPWATLTLDGKPLGETPRADVALAAGAHVLSATCPDTGKTVRRTFTVASGQAVQLRLDLR